MSDCCDKNAFDGASPAYKRALIAVIAINAVMFCVEMSAGVLSGSQALISFDCFGCFRDDRGSCGKWRHAGSLYHGSCRGFGTRRKFDEPCDTNALARWRQQCPVHQPLRLSPKPALN